MKIVFSEEEKISEEKNLPLELEGFLGQNNAKMVFFEFARISFWL